MEVCSKLNRQNFQKCKAAGMKTSWVLTEDDKSKVARRPAASAPDTPEFAAYKPAGEISIKTEAEAEPGLEHSAVKQRRPSSPMSPPTQFKSSNQFYPGAAPGDSHPLYSGRRLGHITSYQYSQRLLVPSAKILKTCPCVTNENEDHCIQGEYCE